MKRNKQSLRSFIAFLVTWAFVVLIITGLVLYVVPHGRVAYWVHWSLAGMEKEQWAWVHMMFGGVFIIAGSFHLYFNWNAFKHFFAERIKGQFELKVEVLLATAFTVLVIVISAFNLPPASWVIDLNQRIKDSWVTSPKLEPPFGHAEEASLAGLSRKMRLDIDQVVQALKDKKIKFSGKKDTLENIARNNNSTPMGIYELIQIYKITEPKNNSKLHTPEEIEAKYSGTGLGRKTIAEICKEVNIDLQTGLEKLKNAGIEASGEEKARAVADEHGKTPIDLLIIMIL